MTAPYRFQLQDVRRINQMGGRVVYAAEQGLGKSFVSLMYALRHPEMRPVVIVCPAILKWNWKKEALKHFGLHIDVLESMKPRSEPCASDFLAVNYDILRSGKHGPGHLQWLRDAKPRLVVIDECQEVCGQTKQTRAVKTLCRGVPHVLALSGTPFTDKPAKLWNILNIVRPELYPSWYAYARTFCAPKRVTWGNGWDYSGASNLDQLNRELEAVMIRRRTVDVLQDLPPKIRTTIPAELEGKKEYDAANRDFLGWVRKHNLARLSAAEKAEQITRMGTLHRMVGKKKLPFVFRWVENFLSGNDGKLIVFAWQKEVVKAIHERFRHLSVFVNGEVRDRDRQFAVDRFQNHPHTRLFVGNIDAAGKGLTLTAANTLAFAEICWTPADLSQCEKRPHRIGTKDVVNVYYLIAPGTIEEHLCNVVQRKQRVMTAVLDGGESAPGEDLDIYRLLTEQMIRTG